MYMVRHNHKGVQFHIWIMVRQIMPAIPDYGAGIVQLYCAISNLAQQAFSLTDADGDKIRPRLGVVIFRQAEGAAAGNFLFSRHYGYLWEGVINSLPHLGHLTLKVHFLSGIFIFCPQLLQITIIFSSSANDLNLFSL